MQLIIADWRLAVERTASKQVAGNKVMASKLERQARQARMLQQVENERRTAQNRMLLGGR